MGSITIPNYTWNRPATITYPGGTQRTYTYDALMRLQALTVTDPSSSSLLDYAYTYDEVGNILTKVTEHGTYTYGYDTVSRLLSADNPVLDDESYTYDAVGNRLTSADVSGSWSYNTNNELLGYADVEYNYDDNGNLTQITVAGSVVWTYTYDAANRLIHVEDDATQTVIAEYYYDPFGRRLWKDVGGTRIYFFYSEEGLIAEYDATGTEIRSYGYRPDSTWTTDPLFLKEGGTYYWYQNDHLGTPQKLVATDGTVVWSAQYTAFGEADVQVETIENNLRFPGQYCDAETGLYYNWFRYYDPRIGRYLKVDPLKFLSGTANFYRYSGNNPVRWVDPHGLLLATLNTPVAYWLATGGAATVGGSVALALGAGLLVGTGLNEFVVEPYITEPLFDRWFPVHEPDPKVAPLPQPSPAPVPNPTPTPDDCVQDDARRWCRRTELVEAAVKYYIQFPTRSHPTGHAFFYLVGLGARGWSPENITLDVFRGKIVDGKVVIDDESISSAESIREYNACPASIAAMMKSYNKHSDGRHKYQIHNVGGKNCYSWASTVVSEANFTPPIPPNTSFEGIEREELLEFLRSLISNQ